MHEGEGALEHRPTRPARDHLCESHRGAIRLAAVGTVGVAIPPSRRAYARTDSVATRGRNMTRRVAAASNAARAAVHRVGVEVDLAAVVKAAVAVGVGTARRVDREVDVSRHVRARVRRTGIRRSSIRHHTQPIDARASSLTAVAAEPAVHRAGHGVDASSDCRTVDARVTGDGGRVARVNRVCLYVWPIAYTHGHRPRAAPRAQRRATGTGEPLYREARVCIVRSGIGRYRGICGLL